MTKNKNVQIKTRLCHFLASTSNWYLLTEISYIIGVSPYRIRPLMTWLSKKRGVLIDRTLTPFKYKHDPRMKFSRMLDALMV